MLIDTVPVIILWQLGLSLQQSPPCPCTRFSRKCHLLIAGRQRGRIEKSFRRMQVVLTFTCLLSFLFQSLPQSYPLFCVTNEVAFSQPRAWSGELRRLFSCSSHDFLDRRGFLSEPCLYHNVVPPMRLILSPPHGHIPRPKPSGGLDATAPGSYMPQSCESTIPRS